MNSKIFLGLLVIATLQKGYSQVTTDVQTLVVDNTNQFRGGYSVGSANYVLKFGTGSGEQIGSRRANGVSGTLNGWGLDFYTSGLKRMAITQGGNVGIGISTSTTDLDAQYPLHVNGTIAATNLDKSNIFIEPLSGVNNGYQSLCFNIRLISGSDSRMNVAKAGWKLFVDQRNTDDFMGIGRYGTDGVNSTPFSIGGPSPSGYFNFLEPSTSTLGAKFTTSGAFGPMHIQPQYQMLTFSATAGVGGAVSTTSNAVTGWGIGPTGSISNEIFKLNAVWYNGASYTSRNVFSAKRTGELGLGGITYPAATLHLAGAEIVEGNTAPFEYSALASGNGTLSIGVTQGGPGFGSAWLQSRDGSPLLLNPVSSSTSGPNGNSVEYVGIGFPVAPASKVPGGYMLAVNGNIICTALKVKNYGNWSDFVFDKDYKLPALSEVETYINENKHLPGIPSAEEVKEDGFETAEMSAKLLQKIEELTLYMIEQQKESALIKKEIQVLKAENAALKNQITK